MSRYAGESGTDEERYMIIEILFGLMIIPAILLMFLYSNHMRLRYKVMWTVPTIIVGYAFGFLMLMVAN